MTWSLVAFLGWPPVALAVIVSYALMHRRPRKDDES